MLELQPDYLGSAISAVIGEAVIYDEKPKQDIANLIQIETFWVSTSKPVSDDLIAQVLAKKEEFSKAKAPNYKGFLEAYLTSDIDDYFIDLATNDRSKRALSNITALFLSLPIGVTSPEMIRASFISFISSVTDSIDDGKIKELNDLFNEYGVPLSLIEFIE